MGEAKNRGTFEQRRNEAIMQGRGQPQQVNINETDTLDVKCKACEGRTFKLSSRDRLFYGDGDLFDVTYRLRTFPALSPKNPTGKDQLIKVEVYLCRTCGHEFGKPFLKDGKAD